MTIEDFATLADQLAGLYPTVEDSRFIITTAGFDTITVEFSNRPRDNWWNILQYAAYKIGALRSLLEKVVADRPENQLLPVMLAELIAAENKIDTPLLKKRDKVFRGFKIFRKSREHAEKKSILQDQEENDFEWFQSIMNISKGVGLIKFNDGASSAMLLKDGYVLSFYWNLNPENFSTLSLLLQEDMNGDKINQMRQVRLDPSFIHSNQQMHYTLLRRHKDDPHYGIAVPISRVRKAENEVSLISHPMGLDKRISRGSLLGFNGNEIIYNTESTQGSAGGPVIQHQKVIGMHIGRKEQTGPEGQPLKFGLTIESILLDAGLPFDDFLAE